MKTILYKGFKIKEGQPQFTNEVLTITKGSKGPKEEYFGGADTITLAKEKINKILNF